MFPLLVAGVLLFAFTRPKKDTKGPSTAEAKLFVLVNGVLQYRPEVAKLIITSFRMRTVAQPTPGPNVIVVVPTLPAPGQINAYDALAEMHEAGFDIYVPTNAHQPVALPVPVLFQDPGAPPPPEGMARLIRPTQVFPVI